MPCIYPGREGIFGGIIATVQRPGVLAVCDKSKSMSQGFRVPPGVQGHCVVIERKPPYIFGRIGLQVKPTCSELKNLVD